MPSNIQKLTAICSKIADLVVKFDTDQNSESLAREIMPQFIDLRDLLDLMQVRKDRDLAQAGAILKNTLMSLSAIFSKQRANLNDIGLRNLAMLRAYITADDGLFKSKIKTLETLAASMPIYATESSSSSAASPAPITTAATTARSEKKRPAAASSSSTSAGGGEDEDGDEDARKRARQKQEKEDAELARLLAGRRERKKPEFYDPPPGPAGKVPGQFTGKYPKPKPKA